MISRRKRLFLLLVLLGGGGGLLWQWLQTSVSSRFYPGYVEVEDVNLSFPYPGLIQEVRVREGERVDSGEILMVEDTLELHYQRIALEKERVSASQRLRALQIRLAQLERSLQRLTPLSGTGISREEVDQLRAQRDALRAEVSAARASLHALDARLRAVAHQLQQGVLRAPLRAEVLDVWASPGERAVPGRPALRLGRTDTVRVVSFVPEPDLPTVQVGETLRVRLDDRPGVWIPAVVTWISPEAEYASQYVQTPENRVDLVFRIHLRLPNPEGRFHAGLPVDVARRPASE